MVQHGLCSLMSVAVWFAFFVPFELHQSHPRSQAFCPVSPKHAELTHTLHDLGRRRLYKRTAQDGEAL